jgi:LDH2 family malate/lactate/ureidoglycolate dehydrogenase
MNRPPEEFKRIAADQLQSFAAACARSAGLPEAHADQLAELLTNSDLRGVRSHGTRALPGYCGSVRNRSVNPDPQFTILKETANAVHIDGDGSLGYAPMMLATEMAIAKARETGVGIGAACHIGHYGSAGHYVHRAMEEGCTAFSVQGACPQYYIDNKGKQAAYYGNPPLSFGLPSQDEPPLVLDGATSIMADYQRGEPFDALQELIPAAFFKSMGYTGVGTALGGVFVGQGNERAREVTKKWPSARMGGMIFVMDIALFVPAAEFRQGIDALVSGVRQDMVPVRGYDEATLPGTIEHRKQQEYRREGIPIALDALEGLEKLGEESGIEPPWV